MVNDIVPIKNSSGFCGAKLRKQVKNMLLTGDLLY